MKHHWPMEGNKCDKSRSKLSLTRTSLSDAFGGFFTLGVGIMTSIFFFILEIIVHKSRDILLAISKRKNEGGLPWKKTPRKKILLKNFHQFTRTTIILKITLVELLFCMISNTHDKK